MPTPGLNALGWTLQEHTDEATGQRMIELGHGRGQAFKRVEPLAALGVSASNGTPDELVVVRAEQQRAGLWLVIKRVGSGKNGDCPGAVKTEEEETLRCGERCAPAAPMRLTVSASCTDFAEAAPCLRAPFVVGETWLEEAATTDLDGMRSRRARKSIQSLRGGGVGSVAVTPLSARGTVEGRETFQTRLRPLGTLALPDDWTRTVASASEDAELPPERQASALVPWGDVKLTPLGRRTTNLGPSHAWAMVLTGKAQEGAHGWIETRTISASGEITVLDGTSIVVSAHLQGEDSAVTTSRLCTENEVCPDRTRRAPVQVDLTTSCPR